MKQNGDLFYFIYFLGIVFKASMERGTFCRGNATDLPGS